MIGYKAMRYEGGWAISGADSRQRFKPRRGYVIQMSGKGTFVSPNKQYVLDYYSGNNDKEVLLTLEFSEDDITSGQHTLNDREPELTVRKAKVIAFKVMDFEESVFDGTVRRWLREATYQADKEARERANMVWSMLVSFVKVNPWRMQEVRLGPYANNPEGFMVQSPQAGLPKGLSVLLVTKGEEEGHYLKHAHMGHLIVLSGVVEDPSDPRGVASRMKRYKTVFIHEFTHYVDELRRKGGHSAGESARQKDRFGTGAYLQDPAEFNAVYQEVAGHLEKEWVGQAEELSPDHVSSMDREIFEDKYNEAFRSFTAFYSVTVRGHAYANPAARLHQAVQGTKWERKFVKRLHGLYPVLKLKTKEAMEKWKWPEW